jgi:hypothetical protein
VTRRASSTSSARARGVSFADGMSSLLHARVNGYRDFEHVVVDAAGGMHPVMNERYHPWPIIETVAGLVVIISGEVRMVFHIDRPGDD